ncbi:MAG: murein biosynthesis integral membrane protein MurJ [Actinomycetota bacterium]|nr:murein biosynthesis integral membrane protein MurJ [Actinomycetota bacterium]
MSTIEPSLRIRTAGPGTARRRDRLARASLGTALGTLLSRLTGLLRLTAVAAALGGLHVADAFNLANNTPNMVHDLVLDGVLSATFIPVIIERMAARTAREAEESTSAIFTLALTVLVGATIACILAAGPIVDLYGGRAIPPDERALAVDLLRLFAPQVLFYGLISVISAVLATRDRFVAVGVVPVLNNVVAIAVLIVFALTATHSVTPAGVVHNQGLLLLLGAGTTAGVAVQALALLPALRASGARLRLRWRPRDPAVRRILSLSGWTFGFVVANQVALFIVLALEVHLSNTVPGSVSAYTYAFQFFSFPFGVVAVSVINVASPDLARAWARNDLMGLGRRFGIATRRTLALVLPAAVGFLLLAQPIVSLLLRHHAETGASARLTASVLVMFALGLPGFCVFLLITRAFQAMQDTRTAFVLYVLENGANVLLAALLYHPLGVRGLALAYSGAYTLATMVGLVVLRERTGTIGGRALATSSARCLVLSVMMAFAVAVVSAVIGNRDAGLSGWFDLFCSVGAGAVVYLGGAGIAGTVRGWQTSRRGPATAAGPRRFRGRYTARH